MALTLGQWFIIGTFSLTGIILTSYFIYEYFSSGYYSGFAGIITGIITIVLTLAIMFGCNWYNTKTAAGARNYKDFQSNINNGIDRTLKVVADDGYVIYEHSGKFDIEVHNDYIVFDENEARTILYRSYTSSLIIEENKTVE